MLMDDVSAHIRGLQADPYLKKLKSKTADSNTLAYLRRLKIVHDMLESIDSVGHPEISAMTEGYMAEVKKYR
ncbi:hypothetical protein GN156_37670, partial [bacterium LRH843]|nr:hypothetical protein [bacterium LRH843]